MPCDASGDGSSPVRGSGLASGGATDGNPEVWGSVGAAAVLGNLTGAQSSISSWPSVVEEVASSSTASGCGPFCAGSISWFLCSRSHRAQENRAARCAVPGEADA